MEIASLEKSTEWLTRPDILEKRVEAGVVVESTDYTSERFNQCG